MVFPEHVMAYRHMFSVVAGVAIFAAQNATAQSCYVPPPCEPTSDCYVCPTCACPSPSCSCPTTSQPSSCNYCNARPNFSGRSGYGVGRSVCKNCGNSKSDCSSKDRCKTINIDFSRTIIKKNLGGGLFGEAPPVGVTLASMPVLNVQTPAVTMGFAGVQSQGASSQSAGLNQELLLEILKMRNASSGAASSAAAGNGVECEDPCADIKDLQSDVAQLREITVNLTKAVRELTDRELSRGN